MENMTIILFLVPLLFGIINLLELSAVLARYAGVSAGKTMIGYSLQQSVYMLTRFFIVLMLPLLGLIVDRFTERTTFAWMSHGGLALSFLFGLMVMLFAPKIVGIYKAIINRYDRTGHFVRSILKSLITWESGGPKQAIFSDYRRAMFQPDVLRITFLSALIFGIYGAGLFVSFYLSLMFHEYRASISQMSGIFNMLGAVLLTFIVEPEISRHIDAKKAIAKEMIIGVFMGRMIGLLFVAQLLCGAVFWLS